MSLSFNPLHPIKRIQTITKPSVTILLSQTDNIATLVVRPRDRFQYGIGERYGSTGR